MVPQKHSSIAAVTVAEPSTHGLFLFQATLHHAEGIFVNMMPQKSHWNLFTLSMNPWTHVPAAVQTPPCRLVGFPKDSSGRPYTLTRCNQK